MDSIYEPLKTLVEDLKYMRIGLKKRPLIVSELKTGSSKAEDESERFKLSFHLAGSIHSWELVFDKQTPLLPPDVITGVEDEGFCPYLDDLKGYVNWNPSSSECLSDLVVELIQLYSAYQKNLVTLYPRLSDQWTDLCLSTNYGETCEVNINKNPPGTFNAVATFLFELGIDLDDLPPYLVEKNFGAGKAALQVTFQPPDLTTIDPRLFLSPRLEHVVGGVSNLRLPPYGIMDNLSSYIESVNQILRNTVNNVMECYIKRKELVSCIIAEFHGSIVEYDAKKYDKVTILLCHNNYYFILIVLVGENFPSTPPSLVIQSIYHKIRRTPYREIHKDYLYSPSWEPKQMLKSIRNYLSDVILDFKEDSIKAQKEARR